MPDASTTGKLIVLLGLGLAVMGGLIWAAGHFGLPLGRLPGDINIHNGNFTFYFPCASAILVSVVMSVLVNLAVRMLRR